MRTTMSLQRPSHRVSLEHKSNIKPVLSCNSVCVAMENQDRQIGQHPFNKLASNQKNIITDRNNLSKRSIKVNDSKVAIYIYYFLPKLYQLSLLTFSPSVCYSCFLFFMVIFLAHWKIFSQLTKPFFPPGPTFSTTSCQTKESEG